MQRHSSTNSNLFWISCFTVAFIVSMTLSCATPAILSRISHTYPGCVYMRDSEKPLVALTIDDGPDSITTPKILEVLSRHQARATFFLISSRVPGNEPIVSEIVKQGHEIGNHLTRDEPSIKLSMRKFEKALIEADSVLSKFDAVHWFRPGGGRYDQKMIATLRRHNYRCALGSVFPYDTLIPRVWFAIKYILYNIRPGSIIVLHDVGPRGERTVKTLSKILPELIDRGFRVVTLSELM